MHNFDFTDSCLKSRELGNQCLPVDIGSPVSLVSRFPVQRVWGGVWERGILKTQEILQLGISKEYLRKLKEKGVVERIARGLYTLPGHAFSATQSIAEVSNQIPKGAICLLSALRFHGFTTQNPFEVWIAVNQKASKSQINSTTQIN